MFIKNEERGCVKMIKSALRAEIYQIFSNLSKLLGLYINNL